MISFISVLIYFLGGFMSTLACVISMQDQKLRYGRQDILPALLILFLWPLLALFIVIGLLIGKLKLWLS